jgi:hypothetical protein
MTKAPKSNFDSTEPKRKGRKKKEEGTIKGMGLFDHIKHIRTIQDPDYFKKLTDLDKKSFNHFMILKALSMNPALLSDISDLFKYFDKIPSPQFYQLLISIIPIDRNYYPWVKAPKSQVSETVIELISKYFEISKLEAKDYALLLLTKPDGIKELENFCRDYGMDDREIKKMFENKEEKE